MPKPTLPTIENPSQVDNELDALIDDVKPIESNVKIEEPPKVEPDLSNVEWVTIKIPIYRGSDMSPVRQADRNFNCGLGTRETGIAMKRLREGLSRIDTASNINQRQTLFYLLEQITKQANLSQ